MPEYQSTIPPNRAEPLISARWFARHASWDARDPATSNIGLQSVRWSTLRLEFEVRQDDVEAEALPGWPKPDLPSPRQARACPTDHLRGSGVVQSDSQSIRQEPLAPVTLRARSPIPQIDLTRRPGRPSPSSLMVGYGTRRNPQTRADLAGPSGVQDGTASERHGHPISQ